MINSNISMLNNTLKIFENGSYLKGFKSVKVKLSMEDIGREVPEYEKLLYTRIIGMLKVAAYYGYKNLVLGAWGCGAFGNDALVLARLFNDAFNENIDSELTVGGLFNKVEFAVLDRTSDQYNYSSFNKYFPVVESFVPFNKI